ncbi:tRNA (32-2'-O)-methyltransferase regulator THADA-like isoform X1 [Macrobrachium nipponense]|uniref:tRNA (32-2'-O)-methyltransferase regulator THADA-like isoform X1 n=2 Tax=Macrobrachium nipponense TaxID=159736 RepID=UPI0030C8431A
MVKGEKNTMGTTTAWHMGQTLKRGKVRESHMEQLILDPPPENADDDIKAAFTELLMPENPSQQIGAVDKLLCASVKSEESAQVVTNILLACLLQLPSKAQLRIKISKFVSSIAVEYPKEYEETALEVICCALSNTENPLGIMQAIKLVVEDASSIFSVQGERSERKLVTGGQDLMKPLLSKIHPLVLQGILSCITQLWYSHKETQSSIEASQVLQEMQRLIKNSTAYLQKYCSKDNIGNYESCKLLEHGLIIMKHQCCPLDLRINCGQMVAIIHNYCNEDGLNSLVQNVICEDGHYVALPPLAQLAVINGILCVSQGKELYTNNKCNNMYLGLEILEAILSPVFQSNDGSMAITTIRMFQHWTLRTLEAIKSSSFSSDLRSSLHPSSTVMSRVFEYLWLSWDHFLDSVKHATKESFQNLIKIHNEVSPEGSIAHYTEMCKTLLLQSSSRKYKLSAVSCLVPDVGCQTLLNYEPQLPRLLLTSLKDSSMASHAAELLEALFTVHIREVSQAKWQDVWLPVFINFFSQEMQTFGYELLFKKLLLTSPESLDIVVETLSESCDKLEMEKLCLLIMCVKIGRQSTYWQKKCQEKNVQHSDVLWKFILPYKTVMFCLKHIHESVQLSALSLLCESPKSTEIPEKEEMDLILDYFHYNTTNQSPSYRQHLVKCTKNLFLRIKEATRILNKSRNSNDNLMHNLYCLREFCKDLFSMMIQNLFIGANTARRGTSLIVLELFNEILYKDCGTCIGIDEMIHSHMYADTLLYVLNDSYESNKIIALKLLLAIPKDKLHSQDEKKLECLINAACDLASSSRPPDTVTASYVLKYLLNEPIAVKILSSKFSTDLQSQEPLEVFLKFLLQSLQSEVTVAQESLLKAAAYGPMYGLLLCIRTLLGNIPKDQFDKNHCVWKSIVKELLAVCYEVSELVASVVRNSSPEGHLPMDLEPESVGSLKAVLQASISNQQIGNDIQLSVDSKPDELLKAQAVSAQMLLLCAWRSVKEISLILGDLVQNYPLYPDHVSLLTVEDVKIIGQYFLMQLSETKHRGAFEQSYIGFNRICEQLWQCNEEQLYSLPDEWLREVLYAIQNDNDDRLCATRRSAGVPFIVQGILSSEPSVRGAVSLKNTMTTLLKLAAEHQYKGTDARIHAFNILRALYRDSRLGDLIVPYAPAGIKAAINGYKSDSWAERNSASLLFSSLITRMFGVKKTQDDLSRKNSMSALVFFRRYPDLYDFLKNELKNGACGVKEGKLVPALFPLLLLLARLSPSPIEGRNTTLSMSAFTSAVIQCISSSIFQLRNLASHALISLVTPDNVLDVINQLCSKASLTDQNGLHGSLLCLIKLLKYFHDSIIKNNESDSVVKSVAGISWSATESNPCLITRACAVELFTFLIRRKCSFMNLHAFNEVNNSSFMLVTCNSQGSHHQPWSALCKRAASKYLIHFSQAKKPDMFELVCKLLSNSDYEVRLTCLNYVETLDDLPVPVFLKLFDQVQGREQHKECLIQMFKILNKFVSCVVYEQFDANWEEGVRILGYCVERAGEEACIELLTEIICFTSSLVVFFLSKDSVSFFGTSVYGWLALVKSFSGSENDVEARIQVARGISNILPFLHSHQSISGEARLNVYEILITLLQDDSDVVRNVVATGCTKHLEHNELQGTIQPTRVLEAVCDIIAHFHTPEALTVLLKLILKEDAPEGFGLTQDDDRVFDKGEMNGYREVRTVAQACVKSLAKALDSWSDSVHPPTFIKQEVIAYLCLSLEDQSQNDIKNDVLSLGTFMNMLSDDINHVYNFISLENKALYGIKNVDTWLVKLGCRAALWKVLRVHCCIESPLVRLVFLNLNKSAMKGTYITEIINNLSV